MGFSSFLPSFFSREIPDSIRSFQSRVDPLFVFLGEPQSNSNENEYKWGLRRLSWAYTYPPPPKGNGGNGESLSPRTSSHQNRRVCPTCRLLVIEPSRRKILGSVEPRVSFGFYGHSVIQTVNRSTHEPRLLNQTSELLEHPGRGPGSGRKTSPILKWEIQINREIQTFKFSVNSPLFLVPETGTPCDMRFRTTTLHRTRQVRDDRWSSRTSYSVPDSSLTLLHSDLSLVVDYPTWSASSRLKFLHLVRETLGSPPYWLGSSQRSSEPGPRF